ncbi:MAG: hypothetical protein KGN16_17865 [Burkholderiales bacterium]|nr:hypothetical protein [Burkholderiales bacterium]
MIHRASLIFALLGAVALHAAAVETSTASPESAAGTGVVAHVEHAVVRGAQAAASGVERGARAAAHGIDIAVHAAAHGVERGAQATAHAAQVVARKVAPGS